MSDNKNTFVDVLKSQWASIIFIIGAIVTVLNYYSTIDDYIKQSAQKEISEALKKHDKGMEKKADERVEEVITTYYIPLKTKCD